MSPTAYALNNTGFIASPSIYGFGKTAEFLNDVFEKSFKEFFLTSFTLSSNYKSIITNLNEVCSEAIVDDWDGDNAKSFNLLSYLKSIKFIKLIPSSIPPPSISVEPSGEIGFEWYLAPELSFAAIMGANDGIYYAGISGSNRVKGVEYFDDEIPKTIIDNLARLYSNQG